MEKLTAETNSHGNKLSTRTNAFHQLFHQRQQPRTWTTPCIEWINTHEPRLRKRHHYSMKCTHQTPQMIMPSSAVAHVIHVTVTTTCS